MDLNQTQLEVRSQQMSNKVLKMNERMEEFQQHFSSMPTELTHQDMIDKAAELDLPLPYYNDNDELTVNWY